MSMFWKSDLMGEADRISRAMNETTGSVKPEWPDRDGSNERLDQLLLVCAAMWELVQEKTGLTDDDLVGRMAVLDAKDGTADGKLTYTPVKCVKCNRTVFPKHRRCLYCGADIVVENVFKTI